MIEEPFCKRIRVQSYCKKNKTTIFKARQKCKSLDSSIKTFDLNSKIAGPQSLWTGSERHNR